MIIPVALDLSGTFQRLACPGVLGDEPTGNHWNQSCFIEGSLEVKIPTIWTDEKQSSAQAERRERVRRKKMQMREKVGKSRNTVFFQ